MILQRCRRVPSILYGAFAGSWQGSLTWERGWDWASKVALLPCLASELGWLESSLWSDYLYPASGFQENERVHGGAGGRPRCGAEISGRFYWSKWITRQDSRRGKWTLPPVGRSDLWVQGWGMGGIVGSHIWTQIFPECRQKTHSLNKH